MSKTPLDLALREAVVGHFQSRPNEAMVAIPIGETVGSLVFFAVEIVMAIPEGPHRKEALDHLRELITASEVSISTGKSLGIVMAEKRGVKIN
jgi:hypothetical protein